MKGHRTGSAGTDPCPECGFPERTGYGACRIGFVHDDGGRFDAGFRGQAGDCLARAIAIVSGWPYRAVSAVIAAMMAEHGYAATADNSRTGAQYRAARRAGRRKRSTGVIQKDAMRELGFRRVDAAKGPRPTLAEAYRVYGNSIVRTRKHFTAVRDGAVRDTWDTRHVSPEYGSTPRKAIAVHARTAVPGTLATSILLGCGVPSASIEKTEDVPM